MAMVACAICLQVGRGDDDDDEIFTENGTCQKHSFHVECMEKWAPFVGVRTDQCLWCAQPQAARRTRAQCPASSCRSGGAFEANDLQEATDHMASVHDVQTCPCCGESLMKNKAILHYRYFCSGVRCALCDVPVDQDTIRACGHGLCPACKPKWPYRKCPICVYDADGVLKHLFKPNEQRPKQFICPMKDCTAKIPLDAADWEAHFGAIHGAHVCTDETKHHCPVCRKMKNGLCPFEGCQDTFDSKKKWRKHYQQKHFGHICIVRGLEDSCCPACICAAEKNCRCPVLTCTAAGGMSPNGLRSHYAQTHGYVRCRYCGHDMLANFKEAHLDNVCPNLAVSCPAPGCVGIKVEQEVAKTALEGHAEILVADHDCTKLLTCGTCPRRFLFQAELTEHLKLHIARGEVGRGIAAQSNRPKRQAAMAALEDIDTLMAARKAFRGRTDVDISNALDISSMRARILVHDHPELVRKPCDEDKTRDIDVNVLEDEEDDEW